MYLWIGDLKTDLKTDFSAERREKKIPILLTGFRCSPFTDFFFYTRTARGYVLIPDISHNNWPLSVGVTE